MSFVALIRYHRTQKTKLCISNSSDLATACAPAPALRGARLLLLDAAAFFTTPTLTFVFLPFAGTPAAALFPVRHLTLEPYLTLGHALQ
jgi:hypothetical protein